MFLSHARSRGPSIRRAVWRSGVVLLAVRPIAAQVSDRIRLDLTAAPRLHVDDRTLEPALQHATVGAGSLDLRDLRAHATFGPDAALGVTDAASFTFEVELRTRRGEFGTIVMCREGGSVHYSVTMGRKPGHVAFEPWSWQQDKLLSAGRLDDGAWHVVAAAYDAPSRRVGLFVDGALQCVQRVRGAFLGSAAPSLRLGQNLDPDVRQPFGGEIRRFALRQGVLPEFAAACAAHRACEVLPAEEGAAAMSAWLAHARRARPPRADDATQWQREARRIRAAVQDAIGLWPPPYSATEAAHAGRPSPLSGAAEAAPTDFVALQPALALAVRAGGSLTREQHTLTRVYWQTFAGYFAGGWLYLPRPAPAVPAPAILCPHGHWQHGARHPVVQARCIGLAQQGYVVLAVDSVHVYDDRVALSPLSVMTWNNLRALELLRARPDVDGARIGCTGASGGGQQTYYLTALECGLAAAVPAVMACHFEDILSEGDVHCACNHTPHLARVVDMPQMAAAFAPRPQLFLTVTRDWTHRFHTHGFPAVQAIYGLLGAADAVGVRQWDKEHTYNQEMREAAYAFFARALRHAPGAALREPAGGVATESLAALAALDLPGVPQDERAIAAEFRARLGAPPGRARDDVARSLRALFADGVPVAVGAPRALGVGEVVGHAAARWLVPTGDGVHLPAIVLRARGGTAPRSAAAVLIGEQGQAHVVARHRAFVSELLERGVHVVLADVRYTGELDLGARWRDLYGRFFGLDEGVLAVRDVRRLVHALPDLGLEVARAAVVGFGDRGAVALFAAALEPGIALAAAPVLGPSYKDAARRPPISRILLHGDLDEVGALWSERVLIGAGVTAGAVAAGLRR